mgnify:CR=1 FL=1
MHKLVDNRPYKVHCPHCGKFMEAGIPRGSHCIEFRHHCVGVGSYVKLSFYSEYRYGRYGIAKSVHWRPAKNFRVIKYCKPKPKPVPVLPIPLPRASEKFTDTLVDAIRDVFLREVDGVRNAVPMIVSAGVEIDPYAGQVVNMNISVSLW